MPEACQAYHELVYKKQYSVYTIAIHLQCTYSTNTYGVPNVAKIRVRHRYVLYCNITILYTQLAFDPIILPEGNVCGTNQNLLLNSPCLLHHQCSRLCLGLCNDVLRKFANSCKFSALHHTVHALPTNIASPRPHTCTKDIVVH